MTELNDRRFEVDFPGDRAFDVVALGMNAVDWICELPVFPDHNSKVRMDALHKLGGGPAATASALCGRYGLDVKYLGRVGDDEAGRFSLEDLRREPMDTSRVEIVPGAESQFAVILVDNPTGERTVLWRRDPKLDFRPGDLRREEIACGKVLHIDGNEIPSRIQAARWARDSGMKVCLDIDRPQDGVADLLKLVDFVLPTERFAKALTGDSDWRGALKTLSGLTDGFLAITRGSLGAAIWWRGEIVEIPTFPVRVVDSTGAGDVFHGAFVYSLFQDWSVERCLRFSNAAGALACTRFGARGGIPKLDEILTLLDSQC